MRKRTNDYRCLALGWLAYTCTCTSSLVLLVSRADALQHISSRSHRVSQEILQGLQTTSTKITTRSSTSTTNRLLDLETDFYDASTGLYSEGVWHNCMAGIAALQLDQHQHQDDAIRIADSLFRYSWDGTSFRRRTWSGNWDHSRLQSTLADSDSNSDIVQANYYKESSEHRCIQHAIALVYWSMLAQDKAHNSTIEVRSQQALIAKQFVDEYWNGQRWTTISRTQGAGTTRRPSASSGAATVGSPSETPYFRAVDQAVAVLACLQHVQLLDNDHDNENGNGNDNTVERERFIHLIQTTCNDLLDTKDGFGYCNLPSAQSYLGLNRNRNFWHEGWVMLALNSAKDYIWPMDAMNADANIDADIDAQDEGQRQLRILWDGLMERYTYDGQDGTIWHWPLSEKDTEYNVRYCGDNVLGFAICRNFKSLLDTGGGDDDDAAFWSFIDMLRYKNKNNDQLFSVADVYPQVRLHPNTELAALLVWP